MAKIPSLKLHDGTVIDTMTGEIMEQEIAPIVPTLSSEISSRRRFTDLDMPVQSVNTMALIMFYSLYGIDDEDIAEQFGLEPYQVNAIKGSDEFEEFQEIIVDNIVEANTDEVRSTFLRHSKNAANTMITLLSSKSQEVQKSAAKDILDRAGHRPVDVSEQRIRVDGGLRIEYIQKSKDIPTIDITPNQDF
jgi:hypothetical protein